MLHEPLICVYLFISMNTCTKYLSNENHPTVSHHRQFWVHQRIIIIFCLFQVTVASNLIPFLACAELPKEESLAILPAAAPTTRCAHTTTARRRLRGPTRMKQPQQKKPSVDLPPSIRILEVPSSEHAFFFTTTQRRMRERAQAVCLLSSTPKNAYAWLTQMVL